VIDRVADLEARLAAVEQRLAVLEGDQGQSAVRDYSATADVPGDGFAAIAATHLGRVLLIFGGAYLLRAMTDFGFVPTGPGLLMGASYALFWLYMAFRKSGADGQQTIATFSGGTSAVLALPLLFEATTKFALLSGPSGVVALIVYCALAFWVAGSRNLRILGWLVTAGGIVTALALLIATHSVLGVATFLLLSGIATLRLFTWRQWMGIRWLGALGANVGVIVLIVLGQSDQWLIDTRVAFIFAFVLLVVYQAEFAFGTHVSDRLIGVFEAVQSAFAGVIAFVAAGMAVRSGQLQIGVAGAIGLALGIGAYALALTHDTREHHYRNFPYYLTIGLVLVVASSAVLLPLAWASACWALLAVVMAWASGRTGWVNLSLQSTMLLLAAGVSSGLLATSLHALIGGAGEGWPLAVPSHSGIALATVACLFIAVAQNSERWGVLAGLPQLVVLALSVWEVGGLFIAYTAPWLAGTGTEAPDPAMLAALRTAVLSVAAVTLAFSSRYERWPEARWLVYPVLVLVGIKLFLEDFPHGHAATLFVALAFVGSALLLVARLLKRQTSVGE